MSTTEIRKQRDENNLLYKLKFAPQFEEQFLLQSLMPHVSRFSESYTCQHVTERLLFILFRWESLAINDSTIHLPQNRLSHMKHRYNDN